MNGTRMKTLAAAFAALTLGLATASEPAFLAAKLKGTPPNTPVVILEEDTGGQSSPAIFWAQGLDRLVIMGGVPCYDAPKTHYEIEHFDPATGKWTNAYPQGSPYKAESGPTDAAALRIPNGKPLKTIVDARGVSRIPGSEAWFKNHVMLHHQYAFNPDTGMAYLHVFGDTLLVDVKTSMVKLTESGRFNQGRFPMHWGAFCFDPVNKEILSIGGSSNEKGGTPGSWIFKTHTNKWEKLKVGAPELAALQGKAEKLRADSWGLLSHARSRFFITESPEESKVKLSASGEKLKADLAAFIKEVREAKLPDSMKAGREHALARMEKYLAALGGLIPRIDGKLDAALLAEFSAGDRLLEAAGRDLASEPCGRAHSQMAWDPVNKKIVLCGGNGLDRTYSDTWLYDPATRSWEQRYPEPSPAPRSAHVLGWLSEAQKIVMVGGYDQNNLKLSFEVWTYDAAANRWQNLASEGEAWKGKGNVPGSFKDLDIVGAVTPGDRVVMVEGLRGGKRRTWALKVDTSKPKAGAGDKNGGLPASVSYSYGPEGFEKAAKIEPEKMDEFYKTLPANTWVLVPNPPMLCPPRDYGKTTYDPLRKQLLWWGGGHVNYWGTEISHYSLRSGCWTASEAAVRPIEPCHGYFMLAEIDFQDRPHQATHAYQSYGFDQTSGLLLVNKASDKTHIYDPNRRTWSWCDQGGRMIRETPLGAITCAVDNGNGKLLRFDGKQTKWVEMPPSTGDKFPAVGIASYGHLDGLCHDSKRDCFWIFFAGGIWRYDVKTGQTKKVHDKTTLGPVPYMAQMIYLPEMDKVLFAHRKPGQAGHWLWDCEKLRWLRADLPILRDGKPGSVSWLDSNYPMRDPDTGLLFVNSGGGFRRVETYVLRLDPKTLKFQEAPEAAPPPAAPAKQ